MKILSNCIPVSCDILVSNRRYPWRTPFRASFGGGDQRILREVAMDELRHSTSCGGIDGTIKPNINHYIFYNSWRCSLKLMLTDLSKLIKKPYSPSCIVWIITAWDKGPVPCAL